MKDYPIARAVRCALITSAALVLAAPAVFAQEAVQSNATSQTQNQETNVKLGKVLVTGSAIPRTSVETPAPVTVITAKQIQASGLTTIANVVQSLAANNSGAFPLAFSAGFANGASGVSLRGLTMNSTLVLIDGKRTVAYPLADDGERSFTDLNTIPLNAVERIEVLKDGASSLYGADAIAGVINIILYPSWTGSRATAQIGGSQKGGGASQDYSFLTGTGNLDTNNYNAYLSVEYQSQRPIYNSKRGFPLSTCDFSNFGIANGCVGGNPATGGAGVTASIYGEVAPAVVTGTNPDGTPNLLDGKQIAGTSYQRLRDCPNPVSYPGTGPGTGTGCAYNQVADFDQIAPETASYSIDGRITVNLTPTTTAYLNASYNQFRMASESGQGATIRGSVPINFGNVVLPPLLANGSINSNDPFATAAGCASVAPQNPGSNVNIPGCQYAKILYDFGDLPGFGWETDVNHVMRMVADVNGALNQNWSYDVALNLNHAWLNNNNYGFLNSTQLLSDISNGAYNFVNPSQNSQAVRDALSPVLTKTSTADEDEADFSITGSLGELPGGPLGLAVGTQWRYEAQDDSPLNPGNQALNLGNTQTIGHRNVAALYAELDAPVLSSLEVDLSGREDHYSDFGGAFSPKVGVKWTPVPQLMLRGTYSRGFRAPAFGENGSSSVLGFVPGFTPPASFQAQHPCTTPGCTGPDPYAQTFTVATLSEANPNIQPERARNYTLGLVFQPVSSFSGTVDYYNILKTNVIAPPAPFALVSAYFAGSPLPPGSVILDLPDPSHPAAPLRPLQFNAMYLNENLLRTTGFDLELRYNQNFGVFNWNSDFHGTKILTWCETLEEDGACISMLGTHGPFALNAGGGTPKFQWNWANTVAFGPASITATVYWTSRLNLTTPDVALPGVCFSTATTGPNVGANVPPDCGVPAFYTVNLTGEYKLNNNLTLTAGILNATGKSAPFDPDGAAFNYNVSYDQAGAVGRFYQLGVRVDF